MGALLRKRGLPCPIFGGSTSLPWPDDLPCRGARTPPSRRTLRQVTLRAAAMAYLRPYLPPDRGRYDVLWRDKAADLQVGLGFRPGFGQQPDTTPEATPEQQAPKPVDAVADHADGARRAAPRVPMIGSQSPGRRPQVARGDSAVMGVFHPGAVGQSQEGRHREHQPVSGDAGGVGAPGLVPLPAQALYGPPVVAEGRL